jgi:hypothetical protein
MKPTPKLRWKAPTDSKQPLIDISALLASIPARGYGTQPGSSDACRIQLAMSS